MSRLWEVTAALVAGLAITLAPAQAQTGSLNYTWGNGENDGQSAGTCAYIVPDNRPLQVPRTLVVDSAVPVGTVLYSWDFNSFLPGFRVQCTGSGIDNNTNNWVANGTASYGPIGMNVRIRGITVSPVSSNTNPVYATTLAGIGLRLSVKVDTDTEHDGTDYYQYVALIWANGQYQSVGAARDVVYTWGGGGYPEAYVGIKPYRSGISYPVRYSIPNAEAGFSVKAELVKTADTVQYGSLGLAGDPRVVMTNAAEILNGTQPTDLLTGNAITVVSPSCRLRTTDYTISMGTWAADTMSHMGNPATGPAVPVGLDLECSGQVADVQFRFEDTGSAPSTLAEKNVTLYDSGGNKVDGLEVQMKYNGNRVNIDGTTLTSTGSHGAVRTDAEAVPLYTSTSQAMFTANYIQNGAIRVGANNHTGPVSGKVNVWVTYN
ncbi:hypothetical protein [Citrobacter telavivensis]|uniref:hypothetical protein n=1 Tax=Citrobacter telavivensis TaxID=2653932 RepID=UPI00359D35A1